MKMSFANRLFQRSMVAGVITVLSLWVIPAAALPAQPVSVEILYLNHGPLQPTLKKVRELCGGYGKALRVAWYDAESPEGEKFMVQKGIHEHTPLVVWIAGKTAASVRGKKVQFTGFPTGSGPSFFQGKWTTDDLRAALDQAVGKK
jgi:hypothetical protein